MFMRRLFKLGDKGKWIILELFVVFVGVYMAFLFQKYSENQKVRQQKEKVLMSLKQELDDIRMDFPGNADYQKEMNAEWDSLLSINKVGSFYDWRYLEPQYNYKIIEYALNQEGTDIVSFELYEQLSQIHSFIKRLEHAERLMTELGLKFRNVAGLNAKNASDYSARVADNQFFFYRFISAAKDREGNLRRVAQMSVDLVKKINEELGSEKTREAEINMLHAYLEAHVQRTVIYERFLKFFPQYTEQELTQLIEEWDSRQGID